MRGAERDAGFTAFVMAQRVRLVQTGLLLTGGSRVEAEDLVQTVLVRLYVKWDRVSRVEDPVGYSIRSLTNAFLDERRRAHRRREVVTDRLVEQTTRGRGDVEAAGSDLRSAVLTALGDLAPRQRAVVVLRHFLDYDVASTATALGVSTGTVKSQNAKALTRLRELLGSEIHYEEV